MNSCLPFDWNTLAFLNLKEPRPLDLKVFRDGPVFFGGEGGFSNI